MTLDNRTVLELDLVVAAKIILQSGQKLKNRSIRSQLAPKIVLTLQKSLYIFVNLLTGATK